MAITVTRMSKVLARSTTFLCWTAGSSLGTVLALWSFATISGHSAGISLPAVSIAPVEAKEVAGPITVDDTADVFDVSEDASQIVTSPPAPMPLIRDPFERIRAAIPRDEVIALLSAKMELQRVTSMEASNDGTMQTAEIQEPVSERFGTQPQENEQPVQMASLPTGPDSLFPVNGLSSVPMPQAFHLAIPQTEEPETEIAPADGLMNGEGEGLALAVPSDIPLPSWRPEYKPAREPAPRQIAKAPVARQSATTAKPSRQTVASTSSRVLSYARPDEPRSSLAHAFRGLFGGTPNSKETARQKTKQGVAVYDISAAKVYMPDGSVLEAHSGTGRMADNPRYVDQKMRGPTPPGTYILTMREALFHGVEALRMTPIDGKAPHNRTGLLTHSYLLRGGREESHGCVAFKNYPKFLAAYKQGKIKNLVVVPGEQGVHLASTGAAL